MNLASTVLQKLNEANSFTDKLKTMSSTHNVVRVPARLLVKDINTEFSQAENYIRESLSPEVNERVSFGYGGNYVLVAYDKNDSKAISESIQHIVNDTYDTATIHAITPEGKIGVVVDKLKSRQVE